MRAFLAVAILAMGCAAHRRPAGTLLASGDPAAKGVAQAAAAWLVQSEKIPKDCGCLISYEGPDLPAVEAVLRGRCGTAVVAEDATGRMPDLSRMRRITIGPVALGHDQEVAVSVVIERVFGGSRYPAILAFSRRVTGWELVRKRSVIPQ